MKALSLATLALLVALLSGCVTGKGYQGLVPGKDVDVEEWTDRIVTPWGHREFVARGLRTRVASTNSLPSLPLPVLTNRPAASSMPSEVTLPDGRRYLLVPAGR